MVWRVSGLTGYAIEATDGPIGGVVDFYFDDRHWAIRWVVVDTGMWLPGRRVLLAPSWLRPHAAERAFAVELTKQQVRDSPDVDTDKPVSRQMEIRLYEFYGFEPYWGGASGIPFAADLQGDRGAVSADRTGVAPESDRPRGYERGDPHLRSTREVTGYHIHAIDGEIGHIEDVLIETDGWTVRYLVVDTRNWWPGKRVLIAPQWLAAIDWAERAVRVDMTREAIKNSPAYDPARTVDRAYEERLYTHYGFPGHRI